MELEQIGSCLLVFGSMPYALCTYENRKNQAAPGIQ
jgi:hypothetical protein